MLGSGAFGITYLAEHIHLGSQHLFEANGTAYFVTLYLRGITLHQWIKDHPRPSESELNSIFIPC